MKIFLTGASGFLGSALAHHLVSAGHEIAALLRPASSLDRLQGIEATINVGRCTTVEEVETYLFRVQPDIVIHTACTYGRLGESLIQLADTNLQLGLIILQALQRTESSTTFINTGTVLKPEVSAYALSKHQFAQWGRFVTEKSSGKLRFINVLLQHMYGPGDDKSKFTTHVLHACKSNQPKLELTTGEQKRDFIYIEDVVNAYSTLLDQSARLEAALDIEVGSGVAPTIREFVEVVHRLTASCTKLQFGALPYRNNEAMHCQADLTKMNELGWQPKFDLESGLKKTIELESFQ